MRRGDDADRRRSGRRSGVGARRYRPGLAEAIATLAAQDTRPFLEPHRLDDAGWVANRWCEILPFPLEAKQRLMALEDPLARLDVVDSLLRVRNETH